MINQCLESMQFACTKQNSIGTHGGNTQIRELTFSIINKIIILRNRLKKYN